MASLIFGITGSSKKSNIFSVSNQLITRGALTLTGDAAHTFQANSGDINSIGTPTGTNVSDWNISYSSNTVTISPAQDGLINGPYSIQIPCYDQPGQTGNLVTVVFSCDIVSDRYTIGTFSQLQNVFNTETLTYGVNTIGMLAGDYNDAEADTGFDRTTAINGTRSEQILIEPEGNVEVKIRKFLFRNNNDHVHGVKFKNIIFEALTDTSPELIRGQFGGTYITFEQCDFSLTGNVTNNNKLGIRMAENGRTMTNIIFDKCSFDNLYDGINTPGSNLTISNCVFSNIFNDGVHHTTDGSSNPDNLQIINNLIFNKKYAGSGSHGDFIQLNWDNATSDVSGLIVRNNTLLRSDGSSGEADGQGIFGNGAGVHLITDPVIEGNIYVGTFVRGISLPSLSGGRVVGNTILRDLDPAAGGVGANAGIYLENAINTLIADNIANEIVTTGSSGITEINNNIVDDTNLEYLSNFISPRFGSDLTVDNVYGSYKVIGTLSTLVPIPGALEYSTLGGIEGNGTFDHPRTQTVTGLTFTDITNAPVSELQMTTANQLTDIGINGATVMISGDDTPEFRIRNAADDSDIVTWGSDPAIINNNERLQLRNTSSISGSTTIDSIIDVGLLADTWSITTEVDTNEIIPVDTTSLTLTGNDHTIGNIYEQTVLGFTDAAFGANLLRTSAFNTVTDGDKFLLSAWFSFDGSPTDYIINFSSAHVQFVRVGTSMTVTLQNSAGTTLYSRSFVIGNSIVDRTHVLCSVDLSTTTDHLYVNGVADGGSATTITNGTIHYTGTNNTVGARPSSFDRFHGRVADIIIDDTYLDISNSAIRSRFIDGNNDPVDPGADGAVAVGSQPFYALIGQNAATIEAGAPGVGNVGYGGDVPVQASYQAGYIIDTTFGIKPEIISTQITNDTTGRKLEITFSENITYTSGTPVISATKLYGMDINRTINTNTPVVSSNVMTMDLTYGKPIFAGESSLSANIPSGLVTSVATGLTNDASLSESITNNSTKLYNPSCRIISIPDIYLDDGQYYAEAISSGSFPISKIVFVADDGSNPTITSPDITTLNRSTYDNWPVYRHNFDLTSLNDGPVTITATSTCAVTGGTKVDSITVYNNNGSTITPPKYYCDIVNGDDTTGNGTENNPYQYAGRCFRESRSNGDVSCEVIIMSDGDYNLNEGSSGLTHTNTRPNIVKRGKGTSKTGVRIIDDGAGVIRKPCSGDIHIYDMFIYIVDSRNHENIAGAALNGILIDCEIAGDNPSPATLIGSTSWVYTTAFNDISAFGCVVHDSLKGFPYLEIIRNCEVYDIASDLITNISKAAIGIRCTDRGLGRDAFTVQWQGAGTGTVTKVDNTLTLDGNGAIVNIDLVTNNTINAVVGLINAEINWIATEIFNDIVINDSESFFDFNVTANTTQTIQIRNPDHSDLVQFHSGHYDNVIVSGVIERFSATAKPGVSNDLQTFWLDHIGFSSDTLHIIGCGSYTQAGGVTRSGIHGTNKNFMMLGCTSDRSFNLINRDDLLDPDHMYVGASLFRNMNTEFFDTGNIDIDEFYLGDMHFDRVSSSITESEMLGSLTVDTLSNVLINEGYGTYDLTPTGVILDVASDITIDTFGYKRSISTALGCQRGLAETDDFVNSYNKPDTFTVLDWNLTDAGLGNTAIIELVNIPNNNGSTITTIEYKIGTGPWRKLDILTAGSVNIGGFVDGVSTNVILRSKNGIDYSDDSDIKNVTTTTNDVTAPIISNESIGNITEVGAELTFTSDEAGTAYWMVDTNASRTQAQVKTGGGISSGNFSAVVGSQTTPASSGGSAETLYYFHLMIEDASANQSLVSSNAFTTAQSSSPANAVDNNGTGLVYYGTTPAPILGADSSVGIISFWVRPTSTWGDTTTYLMDIRAGTNDSIDIRPVSSGRMALNFRDNGNIVASRTLNTNTFIANTWYHVLIAWDLTTPGSEIFDVYLDDIEITSWNSTPITSSGLFEWSTGSRRYGILGDAIGRFPPDVAVSDVYINLQETLDMSVTANRRKFINASGSQVDLGSDGSNPTGVQPPLYFGNPAATFENNLGSAGGGTLSGTFTDL